MRGRGPTRIPALTRISTRTAIAAIPAIATTESRLSASEAGVEDAARREITLHGAPAIGTHSGLGEREPAQHRVSPVSHERAGDGLGRRVGVEAVRALEGVARGQGRGQRARLAEE